MTTIPEHITQQAIETARTYNRDWENGVEIIEQALLAAEKRGREEAAKIADKYGQQDYSASYRAGARDAAAAIRSTN